MLKIKKIIISSLILFSSAAHAGTLDFSNAGFTINSLDAPPGPNVSQVLQMFLPPLGGFSANVNVQIQPFSGSMPEYIALSLEQFKQMGLKEVSRQVNGDSAVFEYKGDMQGLSLHWYAKAVKNGDNFYLVTAADLQDNWEINKEQLISTVESFRVK